MAMESGQVREKTKHETEMDNIDLGQVFTELNRLRVELRDVRIALGLAREEGPEEAREVVDRLAVRFRDDLVVVRALVQERIEDVRVIRNAVQDLRASITGEAGEKTPF